MEEAKAKKLIDSEDRILTLPKKILHRILFRYGLKTAAKTCVLSKAWRYVWCTNPSLLFEQDDKSFSLSVLDKILQTYHGRHHPLEKFALWTLDHNFDAENTALLMNKWLPILIQDIGVESLDLCFMKSRAPPVELPSLIFESPNIKDLSLLQCKFSSTVQVRVNLNRLETLHLCDVHIPEGILDSILSNCSFLQRVSVWDCKCFTGIKLMNNKLTNLTAFSFGGKYDYDYDDYDDDDDDDDNDDDDGIEIRNDIQTLTSIEIGNDIQTLTNIELERCLFSVSHNKPLEFAHLTRLCLRSVKLSLESFSCNLHSLEELELDQCSGIKEIKLSSRSMKHLTINNVGTPFKATIDAPSIVGFNYEGILPQSISFARPKTSNSKGLWKSKINLEPSSSEHEPPYCFNELYGLLEALSQSEVSLELNKIQIRQLWRQLPIGDSEPKQHELPVAVEHLTIKRPERNMHPSAAPFLNRLFHMFRPSFIYMRTSFVTDSDKEYREIAELLFKERETAQSYSWRVLEGVGLQVKYHPNQREWLAVEYTSFTQLSNKGADGRRVEEYRIQLKWRE